MMEKYRQRNDRKKRKGIISTQVHTKSTNNTEHIYRKKQDPALRTERMCQ